MTSIESVRKSAPTESDLPLTSIFCKEYERVSKEKSVANVRMQMNSTEDGNEINDALVSRPLTTHFDTVNVGICNG